MCEDRHLGGRWMRCMMSTSASRRRHHRRRAALQLHCSLQHPYPSSSMRVVLPFTPSRGMRLMMQLRVGGMASGGNAWGGSMQAASRGAVTCTRWQLPQPVELFQVLQVALHQWQQLLPLVGLLLQGAATLRPSEAPPLPQVVLAPMLMATPSFLHLRLDFSPLPSLTRPPIVALSRGAEAPLLTGVLWVGSLRPLKTAVEEEVVLASRAKT